MCNLVEVPPFHRPTGDHHLHRAREKNKAKHPLADLNGPESATLAMFLADIVDAQPVLVTSV